MDLNQFYPTPPNLAIRAFMTFKNRSITRLLEPQAGRGDLLKPLLKSYRFGAPDIDCIEIDPDNQAILQKQGLNVIDSDFLAYEGRGLMFSHILANPPFRSQIPHTLKAWNLLYDGELVTILNAHGIENPRTKQEIHLVNLISIPKKRLIPITYLRLVLEE